MDVSDDEARKSSQPPEEVLKSFAPHPYQSLDANGEIVAVNEPWLDLLGYDRGDVIGREFSRFLTDDSQAEFETQFEEVKSDGGISDLEYVMECKGGDTITVAYDATIEDDGHGNVSRIHCQLTDISDQKQRELIIENSSDMMMVLDETGRGQYVSPAVERELGYEPEELVGRMAFEDIHPDDQEQAMEIFTRAIEKPDSFMKAEYRIRDADGSWRWVEGRGQNLLDEPDVEGVLINARVIDERKQGEQRLKEQRDNLEVLNQVLRHDIRNNLQTVLANAELLETCGETESEEYVDQIMDAARDTVRTTQTAGDVIDVLLQPQTDLSRVQIGNKLERTVNSVRNSHEQAVISIEAPLPEVEVFADGMLSSVFRNLLTNAILHSDKEIPEIEVSAAADDETVQIQVADNGPGIPDDQKGSIFQEGEKGLHSEGTGLGLYLVQTLVERYDGEVWVEDNQPAGSVFVVELPTC